jgi:hypothetical protein
MVGRRVGRSTSFSLLSLMLPTSRSFHGKWLLDHIFDCSDESTVLVYVGWQPLFANVEVKHSG